MDFVDLDLGGVLEVRPRRIADERGYFSEVFRLDRFREGVGEIEFVQENESLSTRAGTVRGLHFQVAPFAQGKLVRCTAGAVFDVAVDLREGSLTFGRWAAVMLSARAGNQMWIPAGFAHGFCTLEPDSVVSYKVTAHYSGEHDRGVAWDDPEIGVNWPGLADPETLSAKDRVQPRLAQIGPCFSVDG